MSNKPEPNTEAITWIKKVIASCTDRVHVPYCYVLAERYKDLTNDEAGHLDLLIAINVIEVTIFNL